MATLKSTLLLMAIFLLGACSSQRKIALNFNRENEASLTSFLKEKEANVNVNDIYILDGINNFVKFNNEDLLVVPEIYFYNRNGELVANKFNNNECSQVISDIDKINDQKVTATEKVSDKLSSMIKLTDGVKPKMGEFNCYIVINWGVFAKNLNQQSLEWYNDVQKQIKKGKNIKCFLLNLDVQQNWKLDDKQKAALGLAG